MHDMRHGKKTTDFSKGTMHGNYMMTIQIRFQVSRISNCKFCLVFKKSGIYIVYLHNTFTVCVDTTFSVSCMLSPWQITTSERLLGSTMAV